MKFIKEIFENKLVRYLVIPIFLLLVWVFSALLFNHSVPFSILTHSYDKNVIQNFHTEKILKGDVIKGEFTSREKNLGIVSIRFSDFARVNYNLEDILVFRIKEKGANGWYYFNNYRTNPFHDTSLFPFGFSVIPDSKDKVYIIEIESLAGNSENAVSLSKDFPVLLTQHQIPLNEIFQNPRNLSLFLYKKVINAITNIEFVLSSLIYSLPLFFYLLFLMYKKNKLNGSLNTVSTALITVILLEIFMVKQVYYGVFFGLLGLWILVIIRYKLEGLISFLLGFILAGIWVGLIFFGIENFQEKINIWVYAFFIVGFFQILFEYKKGGKRISYKEFIKNILFLRK